MFPGPLTEGLLEIDTDQHRAERAEIIGGFETWMRHDTSHRTAIGSDDPRQLSTRQGSEASTGRLTRVRRADCRDPKVGLCDANMARGFPPSRHNGAQIGRHGDPTMAENEIKDQRALSARVSPR
ncbi:hypothetical protein GCM10009776_33710 [Microbacterium deminutum]|uniref:Uncharacterized protein n=1 Tax=Microbacterium deminutum TaxID=344164 RepID=A0ABN2RF00_9MICO